MRLIRGILSFILDVFETTVLALVIFLLIYLFLWQPHRIKGHSMEPNFHDGELILTNKISYQLHNPQRGDVIVFRAPMEEDKDYIKRIIGLPGERVMVKDGKVYINGHRLEEPYLSSSVVTQGSYYLPEGQEKIVPPKSYVVMGDNRPFSSDSREWGPVPYKNIIGKTWFRYWPLSRFGFINNPFHSKTKT